MKTYEPTIYRSPHASGPAPVFVGWYTLDAPKSITRHGETACNYATIEAAPGSYPVFAYEYERNLATKGTARLIVRTTGIVTKDFYRNRLFHAVSNHQDENVGRSMDVSFEFYRYDMDSHPGFTPKPGVFQEAGN